MKSLLTAMTCVALVTSCGLMSQQKQDSAEGINLTSAPGTGCVQGVVINGLTGDRMTLPAFDGTNGIYVLVRDQIVGASNLGGTTSKESSTGQYAACGIPTDEDYVLFAHANGYQTFEGVFRIDSTVAPKGAAITTHLFKSSPSTEANLVLYPTGTRTQDLTMTIVYAGLPVKNATVQLRPTGRNALDPVEAGENGGSANHILPPRDLRLKNLTVNTDDAGIATFAKDDLVLGGIYRYVVIPPDSLTTASTEFDTTGTVVVGLQTAATGGKDPYRYTVPLRPLFAEVKIVQTSLDTQSLSPDGSLTLVFNRPVEIVANADDISGRLTNQVDGELMPELPLNFTSDTVNVVSSKEGTVLKLTPKWKTTPNAAREPALTITYGGIAVRAANAPGNAKILAVPAYIVPLFGLAANPTLVPSSLKKSDGSDLQTGKPSSVLANTITVRVLDQFGLGLRNQSVAFSIGAGGGSIKRPSDTSFTYSLSVTTDRDGYAAVQWALGSATGEQTLIARVGSVEAITFKATSVLSN